jgi:hypothetical protein
MTPAESERRTLDLMAARLGLPRIEILPRDRIIAAAAEATTLAEAGKIEAARMALRQAVERTNETNHNGQA